MTIPTRRGVAVRAASVLSAAFLASAALGGTPALSITPIVPTTPTGYTRVVGLSADGQVVIGHGLEGSGSNGYRWTRGGGTQAIPGAQPWSIDDDGAFIGGQAQVVSNGASIWRLNAAPPFAAGWTNVLGVNGSINGISNDGTIGGGTYQQNGTRAFRWTAATGPVELAAPAGASSFSINHVSGSGAVMVGSARDNDGTIRGVRWTQAGGAQFIPSTPGVGLMYALDMSADGSTIVGTNADQGWAVRTTPAGGTQYLTPNFPGWHRANSVSADGGVIVGTYTQTNIGDRAFLWTAATGMQDLQSLLQGWGLPITGFTRLETAIGVSDDGTTIAGTGRDALTGELRGYVVTIPAPGPCAALGLGLLGMTVARRRR